MTRLNNYIINLLKKKLNSEDIASENLKILNRGKFANAIVYRYTDEKHDYTIKDFYHCPLLIRIIFGRITAKIEYNTLKKLSGIKGVAPEVYMLSPYTVAFSYVKGKPLKSYNDGSKPLPVEFFHKMEKLVAEMHDRNVVHLDLRNFGNIIRGEDGDPYIIDFQSSINSKYLPTKMRILLEKSDISGIYKAWKSTCSEPLPVDKEKFLDEFNRIRKLWVFEGYFLSKTIDRWKQKRKAAKNK